MEEGRGAPVGDSQNSDRRIPPQTKTLLLVFSNRSCVRTLDCLSDQLLPRLAWMGVANELVRSRGIQKSGLAGVASGKRIRSSQLERAEHVGHHGSEGGCRSAHGLVEQRRRFGGRRV